ncbi:MAG: hypothetical protein BWX88_03027 [Planctomycetes bacterium ADurb.Bin126]|nr:MAG: hypothetical protein BWX88_03027 [Planctomycetes bacterium ADurb.Bin126]HOD84099.1 secondary thiamine-phosphate synthase enzyme YjbQ [Phycisphaerae bacterium]HQL75321.1 secondary thiamine-phosphate synthase enzyme YjbQ [Phycisphaerae bacterium]
MHTERFDVRSGTHSQMIEITDRVADVVRKAKLANGLVTVYVPHTTAGVTINENADPSVAHDVLAALDRSVPWRQDFYQHDEGNSAAHVKASMMGFSVSIPVVDGRMTLGTWQAVYFCEFDGPRTRSVIVVCS